MTDFVLDILNWLFTGYYEQNPCYNEQNHYFDKKNLRAVKYAQNIVLSVLSLSFSSFDVEWNICRILWENGLWTAVCKLTKIAKFVCKWLMKAY